MLAALRNGEDLHNKTAAAIFGKIIADILPGERAIAKQVNFGVVYGQGKATLAEALGISEQEAALIIEKFYDHYQSIWAHRNACWAMARGDENDVRSLLGRRRWVPSTGTRRADRDSGYQSEWDRFSALFNGRIQSSGADALKIALERLHGALPMDCALLSTAHDSIMIECPDDKSTAMEVIQLVERTMLEAMDCLCPGFPFEIETKVGHNWAAMVSVDKFWH